MTNWNAPIELDADEERILKLCKKQKLWGFLRKYRHLILDDEISRELGQLYSTGGEHDAAQPLLEQLDRRGFELEELHIDRGYLPAPEVVARRTQGVTVVSKPPTPRRSERFTKADFAVDFCVRSVTCPSNVTAPLTADAKVNFPTATCRECDIRAACIPEKSHRGRQLQLHPQEKWYREMAAQLATPEGRRKRRERIPVEHALARIGMIQGRRARYRGLEKNRFDLERTAVVSNCYVLGSLLEDAA